MHTHSNMHIGVVHDHTVHAHAVCAYTDYTQVMQAHCVYVDAVYTLPVPAHVVKSKFKVIAKCQLPLFTVQFNPDA
jgi:hypothetical protein